MSETTPLEQQLTLLRERFTERTLQQLRAQLDRLSAWQPAQAPRPLLEEVNQLQHRLAGSSGTFGMAELGRQAAGQEQALRARLAQGELGEELTAGLLDQARHDLTLLMGLLQPPPQPVSVPCPQPSAAPQPALSCWCWARGWVPWPTPCATMALS